MQYRMLGRTGFNISAVMYGGIVSAAHYSDTVMPGDGHAASDCYVSWAVDQGVNYFDVAPSYGDAQAMLGPSLAPYRKDVYLACKTACRDRENAEKEMLASLALLKTDYFDVYQLHGLATMDELDRAFGPGGAMELLLSMKRRGIARRLGITCHSEAVALKALSLYDFDTVLFPFNWHMNMAHGMGNALIRAAKAKNLGLLCMKSMIERAWSDDERRASKYPKSWCKPLDVEGDPAMLLAAMRYALSLGVDALVPPGNFDHFRFAVTHIDEALASPLDDAGRDMLSERLAQVKDRPFFGADSYTL